MDNSGDLSPQQLLMLINERDRQYQQQFVAAKEAVIKAEVATQLRFEGVNEFRKTLGDQAVQLLPRAEAEARFRAMEETMRRLTEQINTIAGQQSMGDARSEGMGSLWILIAGGIGLAIGVISFVMNLIKP